MIIQVTGSHLPSLITFDKQIVVSITTMSAKEKFITFIIAIIIPASGISQNKIIPSIDAGLSFSQFPTKNTDVTWQISDSTVTKTNPVVGPLIGISTKFFLTERFKISIGLNYQFTGSKTYSYSQSTARNIYPISFFKDWLDIKTHKVCIPIELGFESRLPAGGVHLSVLATCDQTDLLIHSLILFYIQQDCHDPNNGSYQC